MAMAVANMHPLQKTYLVYYRSHKAFSLKPLALWQYYDAVFGQQAIETYFRRDL